MLPLVRCSLIHVRTFGATKTGHTRFSVSTGMRVAARPAVRRRSAPEKSTLPDMARPTSVLPMSPSSMTKRRLSAS